MRARIDCQNPVYCKVMNREAYQDVWEVLIYQKDWWVQGRFKREKHQEDRSYFNKPTGTFLAGFLQRVVSGLGRKGIEVVFINSPETWQDIKPPQLQGIILRPDQLVLLQRVADLQRGYLKAPTGSGKTLVAASIHDMMRRANTLFLCHTTDLLEQSYQEFQRFGFNVFKIGAKSKPDVRSESNMAVVATVQTFSKLPADYVEGFEVIIIDECHHITTNDGLYARILKNAYAPIRIGLTATDENKSMFLEGFLGPKIGEFTLEEGIRSGVLAEPEIEWINVPTDNEISDLRGYNNFYNQGIVNNRNRNRLVMMETKKEMEKGRSVLTFVKEIEHGENLVEMAHILGIPVEFVHGATRKDDRERVKRDLESKVSMNVIASTIWKEGINIKSLDVVNNAAGGRSEIATIQKIGRALRTTPTKTKVTIKDYLDPYKYLSYHCIMRMRVYVEFGWAMRGVK